MYSPNQSVSQMNRCTTKKLKRELNEIHRDITDFQSSDPFKMYGFEPKKQQKKMINYLDMDINKCNDKSPVNYFKVNP